LAQLLVRTLQQVFDTPWSVACFCTTLYVAAFSAENAGGFLISEKILLLFFHSVLDKEF